eukprot:3687964-Rhodomonas_salina.1
MHYPGPSLQHNMMNFIAVDGSIWGWGYNNPDTIGTGNTATQSTPQKANFGLPVKASCQNAQTTWVLTEQGQVYAWGNNAN